MEFTVLGPVRALLDGVALPVGGAKPQALLGALLNERGRVVPAQRLCAAIWGGTPPSSARGLLHTYVSGMRRAFAAAGRDGVLRREGGGYALDVAEFQLDAAVFEQLLTAARRSVTDGRPAEAVRHYRAAEALWHGQAFGGVANGYLHAQGERLDELRVTALSERISTELAGGAHPALVAELTSLVREHPLREQLWAALMLALCQLDRRGEALHTFREADRLLRDELGIEPGEALRELHQAILADDPNLTAPQEPAAVNQLPAARTLVGRAAETARAAALLRERPSAGPPIVVCTGAPGVGKSALAVSVATTVRPDFPDGVLYADLRGYQPGPSPAPEEVLAGFLRALGAEPVPAAPDERAALFRSRTENRRLLVVLDDVTAPEQVRGLLPNAASCAVLLTSRNDLSGLAVSNGAHRLRLDVLEPDAARELVRRATGEPHAGSAGDVAKACGYHPLAISAAAAKVPATRTLADYLGALGDDDLLAALEIDGDPRSGVGNRIAGSCAMLDPAAHRMFVALGEREIAHPATLAAELDVPVPEVLRLLENLVAENLARRLPDGSYAMDRLTAAHARTACGPVSPAG